MMRASTCALVLAFSLVAGGARADASSAQMVEKGIQLRREHRDAEALEEFRRADRLNPAPRIKAQIGLAEQALGQWVEAERDLNLALSAAEDPWVVDRTAALKSALVAIQTHLGSLTIETNVSGAELWLNGTRWGTLPMTSARVVAGTLRVEVRAKGYETAHSSIDVEPGGTAKERLALTPAPERSSSPSEPPRGPTPTPWPETPAPPPTQRIFAWGALAAAGVATGGAVAAQLVHEENANRYNDPNQCASTPTQSSDERCGLYRGRAETAQTFAILGFVAGGALGVASAILFLTAPSARRPAAPAVSIDALPGGASASLRGNF